MKVLANRYLYKFRDLLPAPVEMDTFSPGDLPKNVHTYDALFVNTTTKLNAQTLPETGTISFVGTGSSGTDHLDLNYLHSNGIQTADAAGCNTVAVAEYVLTAILCYLQTSSIQRSDVLVGLVGEGHVGSEVSRLFHRFSIPYISYDPPKESREAAYCSAHFDQLNKCNILTFHTPFTQTGSYPTYHLLSRSWFQERNYHLLINTSRGGVVDEKIVLEELGSGRLSSAVIDVWEGEPAFDTTLAIKSYFATPHIAGYSRQSKERASLLIIEQFCNHMEIPVPVQQPDETKTIDLTREYASLDQILLDLHPIGLLDKEMKSLAELPADQRADTFASLRSEWPLRYEYGCIKIDEKYLTQFPELRLLGIQPK